MPALAQLAAGALALTAIVAFLVAVARVVARVTRVHDVILGTEDAPGVAARLSVLEQRTLQLMPNGGGSMRDDLNQLKRDVSGIQNKQEDVRLALAIQQGRTDEQLRQLRQEVSGRAAVSKMGDT